MAPNFFAMEFYKELGEKWSFCYNFFVKLSLYITRFIPASLCKIQGLLKYFFTVFKTENL